MDWITVALLVVTAWFLLSWLAAAALSAIASRADTERKLRRRR
jgi:hypothetical protein